jgi:hypothetical protein
MSQSKKSGTPGQEIEIDFFRPEDAPGIVALFRQVYGEGYPINIYYLPDRLIEENEAGRIISSVARRENGEVVGHNALVLLDSAAHLYENAAGLMSPSCRGQNIFPRLFRHTIFSTSDRFTVNAIIGEPVCNHTHIQKMCPHLNFKESGLEVDLMPARAYGLGSDAIARVSVLLGYFKYQPRVQTVYVPSAYQKELEYLYAGLGLERTFLFSGINSPSTPETQVTMKLFESAQVARINVDTIGSDFQRSINKLENEGRQKGIEIFQIWLPLTSPWVSMAANILRGRGYFLGGMLPCWPYGDGLLMQKVGRAPNWDGLALYTDRANKIREMVRQDWDRINEAG